MRDAWFQHDVPLIFVIEPPRERPISCPSLPFGARGMLVRADDRGIDDRIFEIGTALAWNTFLDARP